MELIYRVEAALADPTSVGLVSGGARLDVPFEGRITGGLLAGGVVRGVDYVIQGPNGVAAVEARDAFELPGGGVLYAHARGYSVPPPGVEMPAVEKLLDPDHEPPDVWTSIRAFALCETVAPEFAWLNHTLVSVEGRLNGAAGELVFEGRAVPHDDLGPRG